MKEYKISYHTTKTNQKTAKITTRYGSWYLHSKYDPISEAKKMAKNIPKDANIILLLGYGLGYIVDAIKENKNIDLIVVAEYIEEFRNNIPEEKNIITIDRFLSLINQVPFLGINRTYTIEHKPSVRVNPKFYNQKKEEFLKAISLLLEDMLTRLEFEKLWIINSIRNIPYILQGESIKKLIAKLKNKIDTGIIVSAGPSLNEAISEIRKVKDIALIVSTDTAYPSLIKQGISPHLIVSIDTQIHSKKHFYSKKDNILIADVVANPSVVRGFIGKTFFSGTINIYHTVSIKTIFSDWIERNILPIGFLQCGGSVATTIYDFLRNIAVKKIILVGQDLGYPNYITYARGTHHFLSWYSSQNLLSPYETKHFMAIHKRRFKKTKSYQNKPIPTDTTLTSYAEWLVDAKRKANIPTYNLKSKGIFLENIPYIENIEKIDIKHTKNIKEMINFSFPSLQTIQERKKEAIDKLQNLQNYLLYIQKNKGKIPMDELPYFLQVSFMEIKLYEARKKVKREEIKREKLNIWLNILLKELQRINTILQF